MPSPIKLDNTLGAAFIGNIFAAVFYGITNVQTFSYYKHNGKDPQYSFYDSLHLALIAHTLYTYTVKDFTDLLAITIPTWSIVAVIAVEGISDLFVRRSALTAAVSESLETEQKKLDFGYCHCEGVSYPGNSALMDCLGCAYSSRVCVRHRMASLPSSRHIHAMTLNVPHSYRVFSYFELAKISWILYLSFAAALTADFIIAVSLCWLLGRHRTGFQRTDSIIRVLILYSVNTCHLRLLLPHHRTSPLFSSPLSLTRKHPQFIKMPDNFVYIAFYFAMPKLFLNSLLATLNTRKHVREIGSSAAIMSIPLSAISGTRTVASADSAGKPQYSDTHEEQVLHVQIQTTVDKKTDSVTNTNV
ncbi:hypothetical protein A0H81_03432 [Grifola frondosa]|uniref:DUF6534 domain-containing protein n=1 Tax=Grifola frondosa TaxID=5627 RepID=A0A1C7MHW2_GRIFR|nr:hypothetical protein A0H81_03432 [Grifola frondosa]